MCPKIILSDERAEVSSAQLLIHEAHARGMTIAVAESLTGGLLSAALIQIPGASQVVTGGVVAYNTQLKHTLLGVDSELLKRDGPVCEEVALQMADGVRLACAIDGHPVSIGLATTGVAGPDPDPQTGQHAGLVWIAWSIDLNTSVVRGALQLNLNGDRNQIRNATVTEVLKQTLLNLS